MATWRHIRDIEKAAVKEYLAKFDLVSPESGTYAWERDRHIHLVQFKPSRHGKYYYVDFGLHFANLLSVSSLGIIQTTNITLLDCVFHGRLEDMSCLRSQNIQGEWDCSQSMESIRDNARQACSYVQQVSDDLYTRLPSYSDMASQVDYPVMEKYAQAASFINEIEDPGPRDDAWNSWRDQLSDSESSHLDKVFAMFSGMMTGEFNLLLFFSFLYREIDDSESSAKYLELAGLVSEKEGGWKIHHTKTLEAMRRCLS